MTLFDPGAEVKPWGGTKEYARTRGLVLAQIRRAKRLGREHDRIMREYTRMRSTPSGKIVNVAEARMLAQAWAKTNEAQRRIRLSHALIRKMERLDPSS